MVLAVTRPSGETPPPPKGAMPERYLVVRTDEHVHLDASFLLMARIGTEEVPNESGTGSAPVAGEIAGRLKILSLLQASFLAMALSGI
jgi:hypothetical protein